METPEFTWGVEFDSFLGTLTSAEIMRIHTMITRIEKVGLLDAIQMKWVKKIERNLYEIRFISTQKSMRACYFQIVGNHYYIPHGFIKKTQKTPLREIQKAKKIRTYILNRKDDNE